MRSVFAAAVLLSVGVGSARAQPSKTEPDKSQTVKATPTKQTQEARAPAPKESARPEPPRPVSTPPAARPTLPDPPRYSPPDDGHRHHDEDCLPPLIVAAPAYPIVVAARSSHAVSLVEPLSNGLTFTLTKDQILRRYGPPQRDDGRRLIYDGFVLQYAPETGLLQSVTLNGPVRLRCGVGPGSRPADVDRRFGAGALQTSVEQYRLTFVYGPEDSVQSITIVPLDPQRGFVPY